MTITYPLDLTGIKSSNLVENELHSVNEAHFRDYYFIVPNFSPFYIDNFKLVITIGDTTSELVEDVDFSFALPYVTGSRTTGKAMYGAVTLNNLNLNGIVSMTYQTVGGEHIADRLQVLTILADKAYNPRTTIWDIITNVPAAFPPVPHYQDYDSFFGQEELVNALGGIRDAILDNAQITTEQLNNFLSIVNSGVLDSYVKKSGGVMTGPLTLSGPPTEDNHAVTRKYMQENTIDQDELNGQLSQYYNTVAVDEKLNTKVNLAGDTMTGHLQLNADPIYDLHAATKRYVDDSKSNIQSQIDTINLNLATLNQGFVSKEYVDSIKDDILAWVNGVIIGK